MSAEDRLSRALAAPAAPAKDMHFTLQVMREAEAARFKADTARRLVRGAGVAALAVGAMAFLGGWVAENPDAALDLGLAIGGVLAVLSFLGGRRIGAPARSR